MNRFRIWWQRRPLLWLAVAAVTAIAWVEHWQMPLPWLSLGLASLALAFSPLAAKLPRFLVYGLITFCFFGWRHDRTLDQTVHHPVLSWLETNGAPGNHSTYCYIEARILKQELTQKGTWRVDLLTSLISDEGAGRVCDQPARLIGYWPTSSTPSQVDLVRLKGSLRSLSPAMNRSQFDYRDFAQRRGFVAEFTVAHWEGERLPWWRNPWRRLQDLAERSRQSIQQRVTSGLEEQPALAGVIQAMALGASDQADDQIEEAFRRSGTLHVFAVSGLHVALICFIFRLMLTPFVSRRWMIFALLPIVFAYAFVTGWTSSAARSAMMIAVLLVGMDLLRRSDTINSLGAAALILLALHSNDLFQPGFQLSFGVLFSITLFAGAFMRLTRSWYQLDPFLPPVLATPRQRLNVVLFQWGSGLVAVSVAAWIGSLPLMWYHFHTITIAGLLANCLLVPLAGWCLGFVCASLTVSVVGGGMLSPLQVLLNKASAACAYLMVTSAQFFSNMPLGHVHVASPARLIDPPALELRCLSLPFGGEAALLSLGRQHWLLDAGHQNDLERVLLPTLRQQGVNQLQGVFVSHADAAHAGGVAPLSSLIPIQTLYLPLHDVSAVSHRSAVMRSLFDKPELAEPKRRTLQRRDDFLFDPRQTIHGRARVLYPDATDARGRADDRGLVVMLEVRGLRVLWLADAGFETERALMERGETLACDILIRGSHGSDQQGSWDFLQAASPRLIISAADQGSSEQRYAQAHGIHLLQPAIHGEIVVRLQQADDTECVVETWFDHQRLTLPMPR